MAQVQPAVERVHPPDFLVRAVNPLVRRLVARGRGRVADQLVVLHYAGRRSSRRYDVVASRHDIDGRRAVLTNSGWRHNFSGGLAAEATVHGRRQPVRLTLEDDPAVVTSHYVRAIHDLGVKAAAQRRLGIRVNVDREPTSDEVERAVRESGLSIVWIDPRRRDDEALSDVATGGEPRH